jgi:hypothetical protein
LSKKSDIKTPFEDVLDPFHVDVEIDAPEHDEIMIDPITGDQVFENEDDDEEEKAARPAKQQRKISSIEQEIDFSDIEPPNEEDADDADDDDSTDTQEETTEEVEEPTETDDDTGDPSTEELEAAAAETKRKSEATERIRQLNREKNEAKADADQQREAAAAAQAQMITMAKGFLETRVAELGRQFKEQMTTNDVENLPATLQALTDAQNDLAKVKQAEAALPPKQEKKAPAVDQTAGKEWLKGKEIILLNDQYMTLTQEQKRAALPIRNAVRSVYNELVNEGWNEADPSFYEEADLRLSIALPDTYEKFVDKGIDVLLSKSEPKKVTPSSADRTLKDNGKDGQKPPASKPKVPVMAPGTKRGPAPSGKEKQNQPAKTVRFEDLSKEERRVYDTSFAGRMTKDQYVTQLSKYKTKQ